MLLGRCFVTSFTLVWIKMLGSLFMPRDMGVTSFTLVWIKMVHWLRARSSRAGHELHARVD